MIRFGWFMVVGALMVAPPVAADENWSTEHAAVTVTVGQLDDEVERAFGQRPPKWRRFGLAVNVADAGSTVLGHVSVGDFEGATSAAVNSGLQSAASSVGASAGAAIGMKLFGGVGLAAGGLAGAVAAGAIGGVCGAVAVSTGYGSYLAPYVEKTMASLVHAGDMDPLELARTNRRAYLEYIERKREHERWMAYRAEHEEALIEEETRVIQESTGAFDEPDSEIQIGGGSMGGLAEGIKRQAETADPGAASPVIPPNGTLVLSMRSPETAMNFGEYKLRVKDNVVTGESSDLTPPYTQEGGMRVEFLENYRRFEGRLEGNVIKGTELKTEKYRMDMPEAETVIVRHETRIEWGIILNLDGSLTATLNQVKKGYVSYIAQEPAWTRRDSSKLTGTWKMK